MTSSFPHIRAARPADAAAIAAIYRSYVEETCVSFEEIAPDGDEIAARMRRIQNIPLPYHVAEAPDGAIVGYAYAGPFHTRSAYRHTVENSVYVDAAHAGQGIGSLLMQRVIADCAAAGCRQMIALIGDTGNAASIALHTRLGFRKVGHLTAVGFKLGRWVDVVQMQLQLPAAAPVESPEPAGLL